MRRVLAIVLCALAGVAAYAQTRPTCTNGMVDYEVRAMDAANSCFPSNGNEDMSSVTPAAWLGWEEGVIKAWSGGFKALTGSKLYVHGGGHNDSPNNGIYVFDFSGTTVPTGWTLPFISASSAITDTNNNGTTPDGGPESVHTYNGTWLHGSFLYRFAGSRWFNGDFLNSTWKYDINATGVGGWTQVAAGPASGSQGGVTIYDPTTGKTIGAKGGSTTVAFFNPSTDTWTGSQTVSMEMWGSCAAWDTSVRSRGIILGDGVAPKLVTANFTAETVSLSALSASGSTAILDDAGISCVYDAAMDRYWIWGGGTGSPGWDTIYEMNASTFAVTAHDMPGDVIEENPCNPNCMAGSYGRFVWLPAWRMIGVVADFDSPAYLIQLPGADTTPPTAPTLTATALAQDRINVTWSGATDNVGVTGYELDRCQGAGCSSWAQIATPSASPYLDTGRTAGTSYSYRMRAVDAAANESPNSNTATAVTHAALPLGTLTTDGQTPEQISLVLPVNGALASTTTATVRYKRTVDSTWTTGHPLYRVVPSFSDAPDVGGAIADVFAWPIVGLLTGTAYDVEITVTEGATVNILTGAFTTRALPGAAATSGSGVTRNVTDVTTLTAAVAAMNPGDVISLAAGTYNLSSALTLNRSGTAANPIYIHGASRTGVVLSRSSGSVIDWQLANYVILENMTLQGSGVDIGTPNSSGIEGGSGTTGRTNVTIRNVIMTGVDLGIVFDKEVTSFLVYNNTLTGNNLWTTGFTDTGAGWDDDGLSLPGSGNAAWQNSLTGFGDSIAVSRHVGGSGLTDTKGVHYYRNNIRNSVDDTIEADYGRRNVTFYDNRITNSMTGTSLDPFHGGPFLVARNVYVNVGRQLHKWQTDLAGMFLYNNTFVLTVSKWELDQPSGGGGWNQTNTGAHQSYGVRNNIFIYRNGGASAQFPNIASSDHDPIDWTHNSWFPGTGSATLFGGSSGTLSAVITSQQSSPTIVPIFSGQTHRMVSDNITISDPFFTDITLGANYRTEVTTMYTPTLTAATAPDASGVVIPGITDGFTGTLPDRGAILTGITPPTWGDQSLVAPSCGDGSVNDTGEVCDDGALNGTIGSCCTSGTVPTGCQYKAIGTACSDEGNVCTDDTCQATPRVCTHTNDDTNTCSDGQYCTLTDACVSGVCTGTGSPCPGADGDSDCTETCAEATDTCDGNDPNGSACSDGLFCFDTILRDGSDTCTAGACTGGGSGATCADANICTDDSCNETTDACVNQIDTSNDPSCLAGSQCSGNFSLGPS